MRCRRMRRQRLRSRRAKRRSKQRRHRCNQRSSTSALPKSFRSSTGLPDIAQAQIGDLVSQTTLLTTVSTVDPIKVYFPVSEREYLDYVKEHPDATKRAAQESRRSN